MPTNITGDLVGFTDGDTFNASSAWVSKVVREGGVEFVHVDKGNTNCSKFLNKRFGMVEELCRLRNAETDRLMADAARQEDPLVQDANILAQQALNGFWLKSCPRRRIFR